MSVSSAFSRFCQYMWENYSKDGGKLLVHMGAAGWVLSSIAQITMLLSDKKIDKDQKKFLLPQEAADAVVNVGMYYSICEVIKKGGDWLVEKGHLLTDKVVNEILKLKPDAMGALTQKEWKKLFTSKELGGKLTKILENAKDLNIVKNVSEAEKTRITSAAQKALDVLEQHKNNVGTISAILASILACNIVTPIVRNKLASNMQKDLQKKEDIKLAKHQISKNITMKNPLPASFKAFNNYNSFSGLKI